MHLSHTTLNLMQQYSADLYMLTLQECLKFLKEVQAGRSQNLSGQSLRQPGGVLNLCTETTATFLKVLLGSIGFYSYSGLMI